MSRRMITAMGFGLVVVLTIIMCSSFLLSLLLRFSSMTEHSITWIILGLSVLALFIGGMVSGKKGKEKGWLLGSGTGALFSIVVFLVQYLGYQVHFDPEQYLYHLGYLLVATLGGVMGVNLSSHKN
ncbi:TIGR04086 family membrane protein [Pseudalkalibacillus berkeleyi]|uniref:TIGR04086 family membrane protein n=1 Tax=Pseudalkalibacillus berkeleyi TaxID=1069813 RepID=A0ABS9GZ87_9BACL|nr:TIGR04086 family membrane protein [Pseudalkalibacillus berkeleyi]MCF6138072.1 TIGR04086 family membrane protein [Pseudalkalibacillus berkeleyi]